MLLIVTDGEPTSHLEANGEVYFEYPPHPLTVAYPVRELDNSGRLGAQVTFFRLGTNAGLARFVDSMARRVDGRVVAPELDDLGAAVVGSYLGSRGPGGLSGQYGDWFGGSRGSGSIDERGPTRRSRVGAAAASAAASLLARRA